MELSEPATAVALLLFDSLPTNVNDKDKSNLDKWWKSKSWQNMLFKANSNIVMSSSDLISTKKGLSATEVEGDKAFKTALTNVAVGISAAKSIHEWMARDHGKRSQGGKLPISKIYLTGGTWDDDIKQFRLSRGGMRDFNSSDMVIRTGDKQFFGVSLKKKPTSASSTDPTMINRSIDDAIRQVNGSIEDAVVMEGKVGKKVNVSPVPSHPAALKVVEKIQRERFEFFGEIANSKKFRDAVLEHEQVIVPPLSKIGSLELLCRYRFNNKTIGLHTDNYLGIGTESKRKALAKKSTWYHGDKEKFKGKKPKFSDKPLIDMKGASSGNLPIRSIVNAEISKLEAPFFQTMIKALNTDKKLVGELCEELTDQVLKISLGNDIANNKEFKKYYFAFGLSTGKADITNKGIVRIGQGTTYELKSVICALSRWFGKGSDPLKDYYVKLQPRKGGAASIKFWMMKKVLHSPKKDDKKILEMELRYKGTGFAAAMQVQAYMHDDFKHLVVQGCEKGVHHH